MLRLTRRTIAVLVIWLCVLGVRAAAAEEITACVNPAGQVRLVAAGDTCRPQERRVVWNVQGPQGPQGNPGATGPQGPQGEAAPGGTSPAVVVDSSDQLVGFVVGRTGEVLVSSGQDRFFASVGRGGFVSGGRFLYTVAGCGGTVYANGVTATALAHTALVSGTTAWIVDPAAAPLPLTPAPGMALVLHTRLIDAATGNIGPCAQIPSSAITLYQLKTVDVSHFVPPFRIQ